MRHITRAATIATVLVGAGLVAAGPAQATGGVPLPDRTISPIIWEGPFPTHPRLPIVLPVEPPVRAASAAILSWD